MTMSSSQKESFTDENTRLQGAFEISMIHACSASEQIMNARRVKREVTF